MRDATEAAAALAGIRCDGEGTADATADRLDDLAARIEAAPARERVGALLPLFERAADL